MSFGDFLKADIRAGTVKSCSPFPAARKPSYILTIDFGPAAGIRKSAAQVTERHAPDDLVGRQVMALVNLPARQTGPIISEVLVLGFADESGAVRLAGTDVTVPDGARLA
ncbi:tRNA-binding protein [Alteripontixanthobacter muriae]|uniref:tRNA-binding protein n=1 Tax=Alteripontixanthobacter muriae TaxID=2705546 RepID=UPI002FC34C7E